MIAIKGITVCVDYDDLLAITLPRNMRHLTECVVVTTPEDVRTQRLVESVPDARCHVTDAFTRNGERFNKGAAIEEAFDSLGRNGWILVHDADTLLPDRLAVESVKPTKLYGARRAILDDPSRWRPGFKWDSLPVSGETGTPGYFQLFHADAMSRFKQWYGVESDHAGIGDAVFAMKFPDREWLNSKVLHLGPRDVNWFGRASARLDGAAGKLTQADAESLFRSSGWRR